MAHRLGRDASHIPDTSLTHVILLTRHYLARKAHPLNYILHDWLIALDLFLTLRHHYNHVKWCSTTILIYDTHHKTDKTANKKLMRYHQILEYFRNLLSARQGCVSHHAC